MFLSTDHLDAENVNVIAVDWSRGGGSYSFGLSNIPQVGRVVSQFINILSGNFGYPTAQIRIVGLGLGAHAAGIAGRNINGNIPRIIGIIIVHVYYNVVYYKLLSYDINL